MSQRTVIIIAGPTAVGKTEVAIRLANFLGTEIISADSRQCYREMRIGVARPSPQELDAVPHHFIASHSIHDKVTAAVFEQYALAKAEQIFASHPFVVIVGGTGLYIRAFCEGLDPIPEVPEAIHNDVLQLYREKGLEGLQLEMQKQDPLFFAQGETRNPQRMMRALEVVRATGTSIVHFRKRTSVERPFRVVKIALTLPREELHRRIHARVDAMLSLGLEEEARSLYPFRQLTALQTVGYREWFDHFEGSCSREAAIEDIKTNTRRYAKRQMTWFRNQGDYTWLPPETSEVIRQVNLRVGGQ